MAPAVASPQPVLLTRGQAAQVLGFSERHLFDLEKRGILKAVRIGRSVRYRPQDLEAVAATASAAADQS